MSETFDPAAFGKQLNDTIAKQMSAQLQQMKDALRQQNERMDALNQQLTQQLTPSFTGNPVAHGLSQEEGALVKLLRDNPKFKEAVMALAKGWSATPAPAGGS